MGFLKDVFKGATTLDPKKSAKHFVGSIVDPAGTTIREGRGQSSLPSNAKGYYDPAGLSTPTVIGAPVRSSAPKTPPVLPPIGSHGTLAPPLPGMGIGMSGPKMLPAMQAAANTAATAQAAPGGSRAFKSASAPAYQIAQAQQSVPGATPSLPPSMARK